MCNKRVNDLTICLWNVQSLFETTGDIRISWRHGLPGSLTVDRKVDFLVGELRRYGVSVAGVQATKWFGADVWPAVDGYILEGQYHRVVLL